MKKEYIEEMNFEGIDFTIELLSAKEYEYCNFKNCNFQMVNLSEIKFIDCTFQNCNLSSAKLINTAFQEVSFQECKMLGLHFEDCNPFSFSVQFNNCQLDHSSFYKVKLKGLKMLNSRLYEVDFTECDLQNADFDNCDLLGAIFEHSKLEKADFRLALNYRIDPELNNIKKAKFSLPAVVGLLSKYEIEIS